MTGDALRSDRRLEQWPSRRWQFAMEERRSHGDALTALLAHRRASEPDALYAAAYDVHPLEEPDDWGDLASFREAVGAR